MLPARPRACAATHALEGGPGHDQQSLPSYPRSFKCTTEGGRLPNPSRVVLLGCAGYLGRRGGDGLMHYLRQILDQCQAERPLTTVAGQRSTSSPHNVPEV